MLYKLYIIGFQNKNSFFSAKLIMKYSSLSLKEALNQVKAVKYEDPICLEFITQKELLDAKKELEEEKLIIGHIHEPINYDWDSIENEFKYLWIEDKEKYVIKRFNKAYQISSKQENTFFLIENRNIFDFVVNKMIENGVSVINIEPR